MRVTAQCSRHRCAGRHVGRWVVQVMSSRSMGGAKWGAQACASIARGKGEGR